MKTIKIVGAHTLKRYSELILERGFDANSWEVADQSQDFALYQIHGAPAAEDDDKRIIADIKFKLKSAGRQRTVILLHRPDEIQFRHPGLKEVLDGADKKFGLVFFGKWHINDTFFSSKQAVRTIIPHGFFDFDPIIQTDPIVIGTNTTWGEMRSVKHVLRLIDRVFELLPNRNIVGYVGGKPASELEIDRLKALTSSNLAMIEDLELGIDFTEKRNIFIDINENTPNGLGITFNTQLYYNGNKIRTGESSGSAHASLSIPVVYEMNNAEEAEGLEVIKVPYSDIEDVESADFNKGAELIANLIESGKCANLLEHNLEQSRNYSAKNIASRYIELFKLI